ncbi:MAG: ABC transporter permease [Verrucomicrobiales bacterium]|nr:ABC transporter permease [Verrucomicrobiales bacterium]
MTLKPRLSRLLAEHGMVLVLLLLCAYFSIVTLTPQSATGVEAARQVADVLREFPGGSARVLIAVSDQPGDPEFATEIERLLAGSGVRILDVARGEPRQAREALQRISASGGRLDAIACTPVSGAWLVFTDLKSDFPSIGEPRRIVPREYRWPNFLKSGNLLNIANQIAVIAIVAIGMTFVIITGGIDLSVGSLIALSAVLTARFIRDYAGGTEAGTAGMILAAIASILSCGILGAFTGSMITRFGIPPFIVTLAMMLVGSGLAYILAHGQSIYQLPDSFVWLGRGADFGRMPNAVVLMLVLYALAHVLMTRMTPGRYLYAVGGNREAARLSGVPVRRVLLLAYVASALLAGLGGVIMASQLKSGSATYGNMYELYVIAAVVVGGTSLSGGEGRMLGTLTGAFTIAVIQNGMNLTNVESYTQKVVLGAVILGAVLLDRIRLRTRDSQ